MDKVYILQVQGWGDNENEFYNMGAFSTRAKAEADVEELLALWVHDGGDKADMVHRITPMLVDPWTNNRYRNFDKKELA